jgi:thioredoxin-related protein
MAIENSNIYAEIIEANEFYDIASRYNVSSVPQTTINDGIGGILGAVPEGYLLKEIFHALHP